MTCTCDLKLLKLHEQQKLLGHEKLIYSLSSEPFQNNMQAGGHFHYSLLLFEKKLSKIIQNLSELENLSKNNHNEKFEVVEFGVMWAVMIDCKAALPGLI